MTKEFFCVSFNDSLNKIKNLIHGNNALFKFFLWITLKVSGGMSNFNLRLTLHKQVKCWDKILKD